MRSLSREFYPKRAIIANQNLTDRNYWLKKLSGQLAKSGFPQAHLTGSPAAEPGKDVVTFTFNGDLFEKFMQLSNGSDRRLHIILAAGITLLLKNYTGNSDILLGTTIYKQEPEKEKAGTYINTVLALRNEVGNHLTFKELVMQMRETIVEAVKHQNYPIDMLLGDLNSESNGNPFPLFDIVFLLENIQERKHLLHLDPPVIFSFSRNSHSLAGTIEYDTSRYERSFIRRAAGHITRLFRVSLAHPELKLPCIDILPEEERQQLLVELNRTTLGYPREKTLQRLFQEQVQRTPGHTAALDKDDNITYYRLNEKSNQLARFLTKQGIGVESVVGIMVESSIPMLVGLLAILKAGGAYLPIDTHVPLERVQYMLADSGANALLTHSGIVDQLSFTSLGNLEARPEADIVVTRPRPPVKGFDRLPRPDRSLIDLRKYKGRIGMASATDCISLQATRGCPYECVFCHKVWSKQHVFRSAENIFSEVEYYYRRGVRNFAIIDDCFNLHRENSQRFFRLLIRSRMDLQLFFPNGLRGDILTAEDIDCMVEAGTRGINLSLETASPRLQKLIKKNLDIDRFKKNIDYIAAQHPGVILEIATMHGFPTESEEEAMMTLDFIKGVRWLHFPYIHILKIYPNTEMEALALEHGVSKKEILASRDLAFHELPHTLPFPGSFTRQYQSDFMNNYFLSKNRLRHVLPVQMGILTPQALAQKYNTYLPVDIHHLEDVLEFIGLQDLSLPPNLPADTGFGPTLFNGEPKYSNKKFCGGPGGGFSKEPPGRRRQLSTGTGRVLLLDLSQHFSSRRMLYKVSEQPLGLISLLTYLKQELGNRIDGRIYKAGTDFDSYAELKSLLDAYKPDLVGIRTLTFYKEFFHETVSLLRQWGVSCPLVAGGPYATSDYQEILKDTNIDLVVLGEGEYTFKELVQEMLVRGFRVPGPECLQRIEGIAYARNRHSARQGQILEVFQYDRLATLLEDEKKDNLGNGKGLLPGQRDRGTHLSYVMYTSGSTGKPKGVMVEHGQVNNCIFWMQEEFTLTAGDTVVNRTNLTFDPSVWEIFWPLYMGGKIKILPDDLRKDAEFLIGLLAENSHKDDLTMMYCPASLVSVMTRLLEAKDPKPLLKLPWFLIGAEPIRMETVKRFYSYFTGKIVNTYGPTEGTINNTWYMLEPGDPRAFVPIGQPVANNGIFLLGKDLRLLPLGIPGEICIAGDSVARGYINNPGKTVQLFNPNPFGRGRLYRTGDIGRWHEDGNLEIRGRLDEQVKIRGYRIEPGEIESILSSHPKVSMSVVVVKDNTKQSQKMRTCKKCGITTIYPGVSVDEESYCEICRDFNRYKATLDAYFKNPAQLEEIILETNREKRARYDCLLLYSGGRGSAYALYRLVDMGFKVLAFTYDNNYFSKGDIDNIREITGGLGVDHVVLTHENSDKILAESMRVASTVCRGCFHTSASLAGEYAYKNNINVVVGATLSRGQIIENKLWMFLRQGIGDVAELEREIAGIARSAPDIDRSIFNYIDIDVIEERRVHDRVKFLDFYRYCNISNREMIDYLDRRDPYWKSRKRYAIYSTNCPLKQVGDFGHKQEQGYHYYGSATSWEKRLGHLGPDNLEEDLKIRITGKSYHSFLKRIGVPAVKAKEGNRDRADQYLCAYVVLKEEVEIAELRESLSQRLADYMIPSYFVILDRLPLGPNGKIDRNALPEPETRTMSKYVAPSHPVEAQLVEIWRKELGVERISVIDNFFALGGDSIKAIMVTSQIHKEMETKIMLADIFKSPTIKELAGQINASRQDKCDTIPPAPPQEYYALSSAQERLYVLQQLDPKNTAYNMPKIIELREAPDINHLEETFKRLIERHESLRTSFEMVKGEPVQRIHPEAAFTLEEPERENQAGEEKILETFVRPFELAKAPLLRVGYLKTGQNRHLLMIDMHHIVADGTSLEILRGDFQALLSGQPLPPLTLQYKDYSHWQKGRREDPQSDINLQERYWLGQFAGEIPVLQLPTDFPRPPLQSFAGHRARFELDLPVVEGLKQRSSETQTTLFMVILAGLTLFLSRLSSQEDIVVGTPTAGRRHADLERILGVFLNTLALRNFPNGQKTLNRFLMEIKERTLDAFENQDYPFEELVNRVAVNRDAGRNPLFDVMFTWQNIARKSIAGRTEQESEPAAGDASRQPGFEIKTSKFDLGITGVETGGGIHFLLQYCTKLFKEESILRFISYFKKILQVMGTSPQLKLKEIEIISPPEKERLLRDFNRTEATFPGDKTIPGWFAEQVRKTPHHTALRFKNRQLKYREFNGRVNQLARCLRERGVRRGALVGLRAERSLEMVIGMYAILKAGGAYLPIDPHYPEARLQLIVKDSKIGWLLAYPRFSPGIELQCDLLSLEDPDSFRQPEENLEPGSGPGDLAYILYTSGSTGTPKGVMIEHRSVINRLNWMQRCYPLGEADVLLQKTPFVFDVSVWEFFWWSFRGASCCLLGPGEEKNPDALIEAVEKSGVTTLHFVPSMLTAFLEYTRARGVELNRLVTLRQVFASGEALGVHQVEAFNRLLFQANGTKLVNLYGPTEATVDVSYFNCWERETVDTIPIGKPIDNIRLLILDKHMRVQPVKVPGELHIAGVGLARGYLNRPELTFEKFDPNLRTYRDYHNKKNKSFCGGSRGAVFSKRAPLVAEGKIYKSGDLACWLPDGNIEFLGRLDHQVKIRGNRIELGEIENRLHHHPGIKEAVVIAREAGNGKEESFHLCAYIVTHQAADLPITQLREYLLKDLPEYMIPAYVVRLEQIPLSSNGKVDRRKLPLPEVKSRGDHTPPGSDNEKIIAGIWQELLGIDTVGIHDNFFELGGNSLLCIRVVTRLQEVLPQEIPVVAMFRYVTIHAFARYLEQGDTRKNFIKSDRSAEIDRGKTRIKQTLKVMKKRG